MTYSVTSIDSYAFDYCESLTSITIPNSVRSISDYAFSGAGLTSITIPKNVTSIGEGILKGCGLTTIVVESGNTVYDSRDNCNAIIETASNTLIAGCSNTTIPNSVTSIGTLAFATCVGLTSITIPSGVTSIGYMAFSECMNLTSITTPNSLISIEDGAFRDCSVLSSITISKNVTSIGWSTFWGCSSLTSIVVEQGNTVYDSRNNCNAIILSASNTLLVGCQNTIIPNTVTDIYERAFSGCPGLTSITIPESVTSIGWEAFQGCWKLTTVTIPESVTSIGDGAFAYCENLNSITLPQKLTSIGNYLFQECFRLTSITIPNSVTSIGSHVFESCSNLTSITIPENVTSIGGYIFYGCTNLTSITVPKSLTSIDYAAFCGCRSLSQVKVYMEKPVKCSSPFMYSPISSATLYVPYGCSAAYMADASWNGFGEIIEMQNPDEITIGSSGVATFASPNALDFSEITNVKAYVASNFDSETNTLVLTRVKESPAGEGLFVVGEPGSYVIPEKTTDATYSNLLRGVTYPTYLSTSDGEHTNFILANGSHGLGFYTLTKAGELAAGKAYLQLPVSDATEVKALSIIDDEETAITSLLDDKPERNDIYNLQGQRVSQAKHGLYIVNGKKVFNR